MSFMFITLSVFNLFIGKRINPVTIYIIIICTTYVGDIYIIKISSRTINKIRKSEKLF